MSTWKSLDEDETRGVQIMKKLNDGTFMLDGDGHRILDEDATDTLRSALSEFLACLGAYCPENFIHTVVHESTSYNWVMDRIKSTFKLETKGIGFLSGSNLKIDFGEDGQTYQQGYQAVKEFYCNSLLKTGSLYRGKPLAKNETLTPLSENFIVEKWLEMIDPRLKLHIAQSRGHLFTAEKPHLYDVQPQLCEQMETMLQEISGNTGPSVGRAGFQNQGMPRRPPFQATRQRQMGGRGLPSRPPPTGPPGMAGRPTSTRAGCPADTCVRCYEARRFGPASKNHYAANCPFPRNQPMRILLVNQNQHQQQQLPRIQEVQLNPSLLDQSQPGQSETGQEEEYQEDSHSSYDDYSEFYDDCNQLYLNKDGYYYSDNLLPSATTKDTSPMVNAIPTRSIQKFSFLNGGTQVTLAIDSGCEGSCMTEVEANRLGLKIIPLDQADKIPNQADGSTPLNALGAAITTFTRGTLNLPWHGYVVKDLSQPILCGTTFISRNQIVQLLHKNLMMVGQKVVLEDPPLYPGNNLPFTIQEITTDLLSKIEVGDKVPQGIKQRLNKINIHHKAVFDGDLTEGYNGWSGNFDVDFEFGNNLPPPSHKGSVPSYYKMEDEMVLQAKIEELEKQNVVAKVSELGINIQYASPCMLARKSSSKNMSKEDYNKLSLEEKVKRNRFVLCLNKLCDYVNKKPAAPSRIEDTINTVGSYEYVITADLQDSFNQRWIKPNKYPYMAFHSPFGDHYIFLRSPQGLVNQSEELETMVKVVLLEGIKAGQVKVHADNIYVLGHTYTETVDRWEQVLDSLEKNNLKLSPKKTACFPNRLDLLGWIKEGKFLIPDPHRQNILLTAPRPKTVTEMRSFLGTYHTFYKCHPKQNVLLAPLTKAISNNLPKGQKINWTPDLIEAFEKAKDEAKKLDKLYIPKVEDQLLLTSDYAEKGTNMSAGISATLWVKVEDNWLVVARMSAELQPQQLNLYPCDGEAIATFVAAKAPAFRIPILASAKKTLALVDSKPLMEAAKLLKTGKFSASRIINKVLTSISELNMEFHHISGKMGKNCPDDYASRNPSKCPDSANCKIHSFIKECTSIPINSITASTTMGVIIGNINQQAGVLQDILADKTKLPLQNKKAMQFLQSQDQDLRRVKQLLLAGQRPNDKRDRKAVKIFFRADVHTSIDKDGCMVVSKRNKQNLVTRTLMVVPNPMSVGLLYSLHINLGHPTQSQLQQIADSRFFIQDLTNKCKSIVDSCTLCTSTKPIPKEIHRYKANIVPDHPGKSFTVDVLRDCSKYVLVAVDNFSGFISTTFIPGEGAEQLRNGIVRTITPFMASSINRIRVDRAPGFGKLANQTKTLASIGIDIELGDAKNKNALAIVDQKIKELRGALKKVSPHHDILNELVLAKATTSVNETIRHHKLAAKEIQFSRDLTSSENLPLVDEKIAETITNHRENNNPASAKSKSKSKLLAKEAGAAKGQLVFIKDEGSKNSRRDIYLVIEADTKDNTLTLCKVRDVLSNKLASMVPHDSRYRYRIRQADVILAPNQPPPIIDHDVQEAEHHPLGPLGGERPQQHRSAKPNVELEEEEEDDYIWFTGGEETKDQGAAEDQGAAAEEQQQIDSLDTTASSNTAERNAGGEAADDEGGTTEEKQQNDISDSATSNNTEDENNTEEEVTIEDELEEEGENDNDYSHVGELIRIPQKFPTKGKYIKFRRQTSSTIEQDFHIPTDRFTYAEVTDRLKPDKFGRVYFNIRFPNLRTDGIYLATKNLTRNDFIWDTIEKEEFLQHDPLRQIDGAMVTPESMTPDSSPNLQPFNTIIPISNLEWDHSPERLTEDDAFLWEEEPLKALTARDIWEATTDHDRTNTEAGEEAIKSPLGTFKRQRIIRRKKTSNAGYSSQSVPQPSLHQNVRMEQTTNLELILLPHRPIIPELVALDRSQKLDMVLEKEETEERLIN